MTLCFDNHCVLIVTFYTDRSVRITPERPYSPARSHPHTVTPRKSVPIPTTYEPPQFDVSPIPGDILDDDEVPGTRVDMPPVEVRDYVSPKKSPLKQLPEDDDQHVSFAFCLCSLSWL